MKNFIFGGLVFLCLGAGITNNTELLTVKPSLPKQIYVNSFDSFEDLQQTILSKTKNGYVVKNVSCASAGNHVIYKSYVLVMEKY